jgi:hypothetical protein
MAHWRSSEMAQYQSTPYTQFAFILNLEQHWFTLRRFGLAEVVEQATPEEAENVHWFNLNSFLHDPEWIGRIYLNMMLTQAEEEGTCPRPFIDVIFTYLFSLDRLLSLRNKAHRPRSTLPTRKMLSRRSSLHTPSTNSFIFATSSD